MSQSIPSLMFSVAQFFAPLEVKFHIFGSSEHRKKSTSKFFLPSLVCIITDCKFYQANEKILSYQLQGQPQKMGYSQIPIKKYAHT